MRQRQHRTSTSSRQSLVVKLGQLLTCVHIVNIRRKLLISEFDLHFSERLLELDVEIVL